MKLMILHHGTTMMRIALFNVRIYPHRMRLQEDYSGMATGTDMA